MKTRRILSVLITVVILIGMLPTAVFAEGATYNLWVGGVQVTSDNKDNIVVPDATGSAKYDPTNNTLTLDGFTYNGAAGDFDYGNRKAVIGSQLSDLTILLKGENTITVTGGFGIFSTQNLAICDYAEDSAVGSLNANAPTNAVATVQTLTITGVNLTVTSTEEIPICSDSLTITNANVSATGAWGALYADDDITITNSKIEAYSTGEDPAFYPAPDISGDYTVYAGVNKVAAEEDGPVESPDDATYENKYVKIEPAHTHCICGETHKAVGDHTAEDEKTFTAVSTYAELVAAATNGGNYYLANDIEINSTITVTGDLTLCLNGHTLKNTDDNTRVINIDGGTLNLTDCGSTGTITGGSLTSGVSYDNFGAGVKVTDGAFNMYGGIISGNTTHYGGGVSVEYGSTFTLYDGTIRSNTAAGGGGVYSQGTVTMHGGEISGNTAASGGGVYTGGTFTMHGGEISGNTANYGGGVDANNRDTIIAGGSIINNTANESPSGGIYTNQPMTLSGTPVICGNKYGDNDGSFDICKFWSEIRVTEDFAPTGSPIRVFVDLTCNDYVFLETADSGMDVENYIDYFENVSEFPLYKKDGKYYAGFAIIEEPTSENNYTVKVNSEVDLSSQWFEKALVNKELTNSDMSFIMDGMYDTDSQSFTMPYGILQGHILLNAGDKLIVSSQSEIEAMLDGAYPPAVERVGNTYTFTVTNTNAYMLMVFGDSGASVKLTKNGSDFVEVEGQTALTLDTTNLEEGEYKCKLVWDLGADSTDDDIVTWSEVLTYTKPTCTITFASNGGSAVESKTCGYNQTITAPDAPTKEGFEFIAWYADDALTTKWNFETPVTENKTLYAKWVLGTVSDH